MSPGHVPPETPHPPRPLGPRCLGAATPGRAAVGSGDSGQASGSEAPSVGLTPRPSRGTAGRLTARGWGRVGGPAWARLLQERRRGSGRPDLSLQSSASSLGLRTGGFRESPVVANKRSVRKVGRAWGLRPVGGRGSWAALSRLEPALLLLPEGRSRPACSKGPGVKSGPLEPTGDLLRQAGPPWSQHSPGSEPRLRTQGHRGGMPPAPPPGPSNSEPPPAPAQAGCAGRQSLGFAAG